MQVWFVMLIPGSFANVIDLALPVKPFHYGYDKPVAAEPFNLD